MNVFDRVIAQAGLSADSQGVDGLLYALCKFGSATYANSDTFANPAQEVARRLEAANVGAHTLALVRGKLATIEDRFAAGLIK